MNFPIPAIRHVPGSGTSACEIVLTKANADMLKNVARRACRLSTARSQAAATSMMAHDYAMGVIRYQQNGITTSSRLKKVTFDCSIGRPTCITFEMYGGYTVRPELNTGQIKDLAAFDTSAMTLAENEIACAWCGCTNDKAEIAARPDCAMCGRALAAAADAATAVTE